MNPFQRADRVAKVEKDRPAEREVNLATDSVLIKLVDGADNPFYRRVQGCGRKTKSPTQLDVKVPGLTLQVRPRQWRPLCRLEHIDVDSDNLGAPALHLECPEAIEGANVQDSLTAEIIRQYAIGNRA